MSGRRRNRLALSLCMVLALAACASYKAEPIAPAQTAAALDSRSLDDPRLAQFIATVLPERAASGPGRWDLTTLTLAALYFHPDLDISRTRLALAKAGIKTASQVPNPTLSLSPTVHGVMIDPSPYTVGFLVTFIIETFGKREKRIEQAQNLYQAARQDVSTASWEVRGRVRSNLLELWAAEGRLKLTERRLAVQTQLVALLERRFAAGESGALDVARERINLNQIQLAAREVERQRADARAKLAASIGVPVGALDHLTPSLAAFDQPAEIPDLADLSAGSLRRMALQERTDVLGLLSEYEAAQSALKLEIAKQFPNLVVGQGYAFDQGDNLFDFSISFDLPIFNQNQGPIAEATARRKEAAAKFIALQARIIGDIDRGIAAYRAAAQTLATADILVKTQVQLRQRLDRAYRLGEVDRLAPLTGDFELAAIELSRFEAVVQQRQALELIEDALQRSMFDVNGLTTTGIPKTVPASTMAGKVGN